MPAYDPKKNTFTWGSTTAQMYAAESMIEAAYNEEQFSFQPSLSGSGARSLNNNRSGTIKVHLLASSPTNDAFMAQAALDLATGAGSLAGSVVSVYQPSSKATAANLWVKKIPDLALAKQVGEVVWEFETDALDMAIGGATAGAI